jgi:hypothetical protein
MNVSWLQTKHPHHPRTHPPLFLFLLCFRMVPNSSSIFMADFKILPFHVHVQLHRKWYKYTLKKVFYRSKCFKMYTRIVTPSSSWGESTLWNESRLLSHSIIFQGYHVWTLTMSLLWKKFTIFLLNIIISTIKSKSKNIKCKKNVTCNVMLKYICIKKNVCHKIFKNSNIFI